MLTLQFSLKIKIDIFEISLYVHAVYSLPTSLWKLLSVVKL